MLLIPWFFALIFRKLKAGDMPELEWPATELDLGEKHMGDGPAPVDHNEDEEETGHRQYTPTASASNSTKNTDFKSETVDEYERSRSDEDSEDLVEPQHPASVSGIDKTAKSSSSNPKVMTEAEHENSDSNGHLSRLNPLNVLKKTWTELKSVVVKKDDSKKHLPEDKEVSVVSEERESVSRLRRHAHGPLGHQSMMGGQSAAPLPAVTFPDNPATVTVSHERPPVEVGPMESGKKSEKAAVGNETDLDAAEKERHSGVEEEVGPEEDHEHDGSGLQ